MRKWEPLKESLIENEAKKRNLGLFTFTWMNIFLSEKLKKNATSIIALLPHG